MHILNALPDVILVWFRRCVLIAKIRTEEQGEDAVIHEAETSKIQNLSPRSFRIKVM